MGEVIATARKLLVSAVVGAERWIVLKATRLGYPTAAAIFDI